MKELLCYIWQQRIHTRLTFAPGRQLEVLDPGIRNVDDGPDFLNASFVVDGRIWTGSVAVHQKSSDWNLYKHNTDTAFNCVILYLVMTDDGRVQRADRRTLTPVVMPVPDNLSVRYESLTDSELACAKYWDDVPQQLMASWKYELVTERVMRKIQRVRDLLNDKSEEWQEAFYVLLCRALGTGVNGDPFERLARSLPYSCLMEVVYNPIKTQALLLGQAGLFEEKETVIDERYRKLSVEYNLLRARFQLTPLPLHVWTYKHIRPQAKPPVRIATLAALISARPELCASIIKSRTIEQITSLLQVPSHKGHAFDDLPFYMGKNTIYSLIINAVVPFMVAYGQALNDKELIERAMTFLNVLPAEKNHYVEVFKSAGWSVDNAYDTQALLQLQSVYCVSNKCLRCRIGCWIMKQ